MSESWGERITRVRKQLGLSQKEFAEKFGIALVTMNRIENDHRRPDVDFLQKLGDKFDVDLNWLLCGTETRDLEVRSGVPLLSDTALAGGDREKTTTEKLYLPQTPECDFAYRVRDEAMAPLFQPGDYLLVKEPGSEDGGKTGEVVLYLDAGSIVRIRRLGRTEAGEVFVAESVGYPPRQRSGEERILGTVVARASISPV